MKYLSKQKNTCNNMKHSLVTKAMRLWTSMHVFPATANDCILQTNSFGLVNRQIFRPTDKNGTAWFYPLSSQIPVFIEFLDLDD